MWSSCRAQKKLEISHTSPRTHSGSLPIDIQPSVTKSPSPLSFAHVRSPRSKQQHHQQPAHQSQSGTVTQRVSATVPTATTAAGHSNHISAHQQQQQQQQNHHHRGNNNGRHCVLSAEKLKQQRLMLLKWLATWLCIGLAALIVLGSLVPAAELQPAQPTDVLLDLGPYFFNPSIVRHRGVYLSTARTAHMKRIDRTNWWFNEAYICMSTTSQFKSVSCRKFDPWQG